MAQIRITKHHKLKELCAMHPNDPIFHTQLAEHFKKTGHEIRAIYAAKKAYRILVQQHPIEAKALIATFGDEVASSKTNPLVSENYTPLSEIFNRFSLARKKLRLAEGSVLFRKGDSSDFVYLVLQGELAVSSDAHGNHALLNYLQSGALVGEGALSTGTYRSATVAANASTTLLKFSAKELKQAFDKHPELHMLFAKEIKLRQRVVDLSSSQVFACLPTDIRFMLAKRAWNDTHSTHDTIKRANKYMPYVELLTHGTVHLYEHETNKAPLYCGRLNSGEILGLHKIMNGQASKLSYVASTPCQVVCLDFALIEDIMGLSSRFSQRIRDKAASFSSQFSRTMTLQKDAPTKGFSI